ncbi:UDP-3-O-(3-hydroxymyristoyl)glucosamine N-acyltransferase [Fusobacterium sp. PH5-44]|uniref:UDP-3-O-(3-hydroxymyristoyl)glucosamine N-acyltransferase n=1 Tax=unclassified Fusobacterium TaxID=2648384 RepID=UPI003D1CDA08
MSYKIADLVAILNCEIRGELSSDTISGLTPFFQSREDSITFADSDKFLKKLNETKAKFIIVPDVDLPKDLGKTYLVVKENPRELMPKILAFFKRKLKPFSKPIEDSAKIGNNSNIAPNVYIGHDVIIGDNVTIYPNVSIGQGVVIGNDTIIYPNTVIREFCQIGKSCVLNPGCIIGGDGFGFVKINGNNTKIDQIGAVILEDYVEVGSNTTIDRGAIGNTIVKKYVKIDNLVQIAHNVIVGENTLIVSQVGISGSAEIGENVTIAGQAGVAGHIKIGNNVMIGGRGGVTGSVDDNQILSGFPLVPLKDDLRIKAALKKLPETMKKIKKLEELIKE